MFKYILFLLCTTVSALQADPIRFMYKDPSGMLHSIQPCYTDAFLRTIPSEKMPEVIEHIAFSPVKMDNGEYALHAHVRGLGGGPWGAYIGGIVGKFTVSFVCHGTILVVSSFTGPAAPATALALEATFGGVIEGASTIGCLAGCLTGAVATGPV